MQLWIEINVVTLHKVAKQCHSKCTAFSKHKMVQPNMSVCDFFLGQAVYVDFMWQVCVVFKCTGVLY